MEGNFGCNESFVSESLEKHDDTVDENDNYKYVEKAINHQPVDAALANLDVLPCKIVHVESVPESLFAATGDHNARQRQMTLTEYFSELPPGKSGVELERDDASKKMINFPLLLSQLLSARVVLARLPELPKPDDEVEPGLISICKVGVQRYCYKCKTFDVDYDRVTARKVCSRCSTVLLFVCDKCDESHYHTYAHMARHRRRCEGRKTGKSLADVVMIYCAECPFETSHPIAMENHLKSKRHTVLDGERPHENSIVMEIDAKHRDRKKRNVKTFKKKQKADQSQFIVKRSDIDFPNVRKRYCPNCAKTVSCSSGWRSDKTCEICNATLLYQCGNCDHRSAHYRSMLYHLKAKCYPSLYRCPKCEFTATIWNCMSNHLKRKCDQGALLLRCDEDGKKRAVEKKKFRCEHCSGGVNYKYNLKRHLKKFHSELFA